MSGESVAFVGPELAVVAGAASVIAAVRAGSAAFRLIDSLVDADLARAREAAARVTERRTQERSQRERGQALADSFQHLEQAAAAVASAGEQELLAPLKPAKGGLLHDDSAARDEAQAFAAALEALSRTLEETRGSLPPKFDPHVEKMAKRVLRLREMLKSGRRVYASELRAVAKLVKSSIDDMQTRAAQHLAVAEKWATLVAPATELLELSLKLPECEEATALFHEVHSGAAGSPPATSAERCQAKMEDLRSRVELANRARAARLALGEKLQEHFLKLGYTPEAPFEEASGESVCARMRMKRGETVRVTIQKNGQLAFRLLHEASPLEAFRAAEREWCSDLKLIIRGLVEEGFQYAIQFERLVPEEKIEAALVEDPAEIAWEQPRTVRRKIARAKGRRP